MAAIVRYGGVANNSPKIHSGYLHNLVKWVLISFQLLGTWEEADYSGKGNEQVV